MRTTLDIDEDVLQAAKELAARRGSTAGRILSELARLGLRRGSPPTTGPSESEMLGFRPFPSRGAVVTTALVRAIEDDEGT
jgi:hypothetical protein